MKNLLGEKNKVSEFMTKFLVDEAKTTQFNPYRDSSV